MQTDKVRSYLGFARRAGKLTLGVNGAATLKKGVFLLLADHSAAKNTQKEILKLQQKLSCPLLFTDDLEGLTGKAGCKLVAVREEHLAQAIARALQD